MGTTKVQGTGTRTAPEDGAVTRSLYDDGNSWPEVLPPFTQTLGPRTFEFRDYRGLSRRDKQRAKVVLAEAWELLAPEIMCRSEGNQELEEKIVGDSAGTSGAAQAVAEFQAKEADRLSEAEYVGDTARPIVFGVFENNVGVGAFMFYAINVRLVQGDNVWVSTMPFPAFHRVPNTSLANQMRVTADLCERALDFGPVVIRGKTVRVGEIRTLTYVNATRQSRGDIECYLWNQEIDSRNGVSVEVITTVDTAWGRELRQIRKLP